MWDDFQQLLNKNLVAAVPVPGNRAVNKIGKVPFVVGFI